jgi:purine nucleoside permease
MVLVLLLTVMFLLFTGSHVLGRSIRPSPRPLRLNLKVLVITMYETGTLSGFYEGEPKPWIENRHLIPWATIPGGYSPLYLDGHGLGLIVTGPGIANATASLMAIGLNPALDLSKTYILVAGIAGTPPTMTSIGSAAWAEWVVDGDLAGHMDSREMPGSWEFEKFRLGCSEPWCDNGWSIGTEVYHLNPVLTEWAFRLSESIKLADSQDAQKYRMLYPATWPGAQAPFVAKCDNISGSTYFMGATDSAWASWWVEQWTDGQGKYCMTGMEDSGTLTALKRLADAGKVSLDRVMVLRTASDYDQGYPGQDTDDFVVGTSVGIGLAIENAYRVGSAVADHIIGNWAVWVSGVPPLPE